MKQKNNKLLTSYLVLLSLSGLICFSSLSYGGLIGGYNLRGHLCPHKQLRKTEDKLTTSGVDISYLGDDVGLTIANSSLFDSGSTFLKNSFILDHVANFLNCYSKIGVQIVVYSNSEKNADEDLALAYQQAAKIKKYLWATGLDARLLSAEGKAIGSRLHERIEINTKRLP